MALDGPLCRKTIKKGRSGVGEMAHFLVSPRAKRDPLHQVRVFFVPRRILWAWSHLYRRGAWYNLRVETNGVLEGIRQLVNGWRRLRRLLWWRILPWKIAEHDAPKRVKEGSGVDRGTDELLLYKRRMKR
jgi:hypothetical protein